MSDTSALRLYTPDVPPKSLSDALVELFIPHLIKSGRSQDTVQSYRLYVRTWAKWEALHAARYRTAYPVPLQNVKSEHLEAFRDWLVEDQNFSPRNANKYTGGVQAVLAHCAARGRGEWSIESSPRIPPLPAAAGKPKLYFRFLVRAEIDRITELIAAECDQGLAAPLKDELAELRSRDELSRLYRGCSAAWWPTIDRSGRPVNPRQQWRAAIVMLTLYGFRLGELVAQKPKHNALAWDQISWQAETPVPGYHATNPHGWFWYTPQKQAWAKSEPLVLPLAEVAAEHLRRIMPEDADVGSTLPIFNWPQTKHALYSVWQAIIAQAGIVTKRDLRTGRALALRPENLRKTCDTWHNYHRPGVAPLVTGHAARSETLAARASIAGSSIVARHYDNAEFAVVEAIRELPIPEAWLEGMRRPAEPQIRQLRLF